MELPGDHENAGGSGRSEHEGIHVIPAFSEHIQRFLTMNQHNCHMIALKLAGINLPG